MDNIQTQISADGKTLLIAVALDKPLHDTKGGKGSVLGETKGFRNVPQDANIAFSAMVYRRKAK